ncbi:bromodomain adjacent to zinc finger domain protein 1A isoform X2 [Chelonus insularis]|uniref:bromodomain adjacent to zinc finger domain protein 1A isoform X2 n=1 Tax=Chelonus insularis TaxID=460826 RepID=UPI001588F5E0|nr:bromodomain adjacent to zinc finger domain protein 1A isoform X2 [Chelonus insularis]
MPYLRKKPFQRLYVSSDYKDDDEVFHCEVTNEVFKDYNEYCERIILCNSTIWSCSITGKTNMTYEEAVACEENAKKILKEFPMELRTPILYLATKTKRTSFSEMIEDIYQFARDRYFVGEMVEACFADDSWCDCHILQVIEPTDEQIKAYEKDSITSSPQERLFHPPAKLFRYEVEQLDSNSHEMSEIMIVEASQIRRKKSLYSRERNKIFLRMLCEQNSQGVWVVKNEVQQKYGIAKVRFDTIFAGPFPDFTSVSFKKPIVKQKQVTIDKFLTSDVSKHRAFEKPENSDSSSKGEIHFKKHKRSRLNGKIKEEKEAKLREEKEKRQEKLLEIREKKKEEKQKLAALAAYVREWNKPREDLECEDLRPIIEATPVKCAIPNDKFGDFVMILEFLQFFSKELEVSSYFPHGLSIDILEKAMLIKEASGPWSDLLQLLLVNIFKFQAEEEDEIASNSLDYSVDFDHAVSSMAEAVKLATSASSWCQKHYGNQLSELTLDHVTLSEILRQHLLSSGGRISEVASKWRYSQRGGYTNHDDPALLLRINQPRILRLLGHRSVCEFDLEDRLCLATCLINQLLTFASIRDVIDVRYEKIHQARRELKSLILSEQKKEREEKEKMKEREKDGKIEGKEVKENVDEKPKKTRGSREEEKKKEEIENKLTELRLASKDDQMMLCLGSDRAHRRYWRFLSIPGLFVENDERWPGMCLTDGTPYLPELQDKDAANIYLKNKFEDEFSDKENNINKTKKLPKKTVTFADKNGIIKSPTKKDSNDERCKLMACTGDKECPIHCKRSEVKWSFYGNKEDLEKIINGLSNRGIREGELKNNLSQELENLQSIIENCPKHKLNSEVFPLSTKEASNKPSKKTKVENTNLSFPSTVPVDEALELALRDFILETEDKIKNGCLGSLKVKDRDAWRNAITNCHYDKQCDKLMFTYSEIEVDVPVNSALDKIKNETKLNSRPGTPDSEVGSGNGKVYRDPGKYLGPPEESELHPDSQQQIRIRQMACAILQLSQAVESKYMKKPLGNDEKDKKHSSDEVRERWEQSLMMSTSWSQLFLHVNTLEASLAWSKSILNARCRLCRKSRDAENMLLCDGCNKGHHLYCLKPKLTSVPEGDWFCSQCKPPETKPKPKRRRRKFEEEEDEETDENVIIPDTRQHRSRKVLTSDEEADSESGNRESGNREIKDEKPKRKQTCVTCSGSGSLITCSTCDRCFHFECVDPPLSRTPRGKWLCHACKSVRRNGVKHVRDRDGERDKRLCATAARSRIHDFVKSLLRKESSDCDGESSISEETETRQTRRATKRAAADQDKTLLLFLNELMHHKDSWPFLSPVTTEEVPDYYDFIKNPMDFGTIQDKFNKGIYDDNIPQFLADVLLIFENCNIYNEQHSAVYKAGMKLSKFFEKRSKELGFNCNEEASQAPANKKRKVEDKNSPKKIAEEAAKVSLKEEKIEIKEEQMEINGNS